ncbi:hypothetical protein [Streptomyces sp. URMC 123]|uniref:hypothetical protein n=1 Tax=Streptomyces sp. URMC 123 TaxID=3423403 RepID=UPI003F19F1F4
MADGAAAVTSYGAGARRQVAATTGRAVRGAGGAEKPSPAPVPTVRGRSASRGLDRWTAGIARVVPRAGVDVELRSFSAVGAVRRWARGPTGPADASAGREADCRGAAGAGPAPGTAPPEPARWRTAVPLAASAPADGPTAFRDFAARWTIGGPADGPAMGDGEAVGCAAERTGIAGAAPLPCASAPADEPAASRGSAARWTTGGPAADPAVGDGEAAERTGIAGASLLPAVAPPAVVLSPVRVGIEGPEAGAGAVGGTGGGAPVRPSAWSALRCADPVRPRSRSPPPRSGAAGVVAVGGSAGSGAPIPARLPGLDAGAPCRAGSFASRGGSDRGALGRSEGAGDGVPEGGVPAGSGDPTGSEPIRRCRTGIASVPVTMGAPDRADASLGAVS